MFWNNDLKKIQIFLIPRITPNIKFFSSLPGKFLLFNNKIVKLIENEETVVKSFLYNSSDCTVIQE